MVHTTSFMEILSPAHHSGLAGIGDQMISYSERSENMKEETVDEIQQEYTIEGFPTADVFRGDMY